MLYALSDKATWRIDQFNSLYEEIYSNEYEEPPQNLKLERNSTKRILESLGHCEFDYENKLVFVNSPSLLNLPTSNSQAAVLTGARDQDLQCNVIKAALNRGIRPYKKPQRDYHLIPDAVWLEAKETEEIKEIADNAGINFEKNNPALDILTSAQGVDDILKSDDFEPRDDLNWRCRVFSPKELRLVPRYQPTGLTKNIRFAEYVHPRTQRMENWLWKGDHALANIDRDLGRYVVLASEGINVVLFDHLHNRLAVPEFVPLPKALSEALTLCSGIAPQRSALRNGNKFGLPSELKINIFTKIPIEFCNVLCSKLSQKPMVNNLELKNSIE